MVNHSGRCEITLRQEISVAVLLFCGDCVVTSVPAVQDLVSKEHLVTMTDHLMV